MTESIFRRKRFWLGLAIAAVCFYFLFRKTDWVSLVGAFRQAHYGWIALSLPYVYVFDAAGDKRRVVQLEGAGTISPSSLAFSREGRLIVTPGGYEFDAGSPARNLAAPGMTR